MGAGRVGDVRHRAVIGVAGVRGPDPRRPAIVEHAYVHPGADRLGGVHGLRHLREARVVGAHQFIGRGLAQLGDRQPAEVDERRQVLVVVRAHFDRIGQEVRLVADIGPIRKLGRVAALGHVVVAHAVNVLDLRAVGGHAVVDTARKVADRAGGRCRCIGTASVAQPRDQLAQRQLGGWLLVAHGSTTPSTLARPPTALLLFVSMKTSGTSTLVQLSPLKQ